MEQKRPRKSIASMISGLGPLLSTAAKPIDGDAMPGIFKCSSPCWSFHQQAINIYRKQLNAILAGILCPLFAAIEAFFLNTRIARNNMLLSIGLKGSEVLTKTSVCFDKKVKTFLGKGADLFNKR